MRQRIHIKLKYWSINQLLGMSSVTRVPADVFINSFAAHLKNRGIIKCPAFTDYVKTGVSRQYAPGTPIGFTSRRPPSSGTSTSLGAIPSAWLGWPESTVASRRAKPPAPHKESQLQGHQVYSLSVPRPEAPHSRREGPPHLSERAKDGRGLCRGPPK